MQWVESYLPFGGRLLNDPRTANNRQWFQDKPQDVESGLSYFGARYYDPAIGRFMATDPQGYNEANLNSFNRYTYGNNNPYRYTDPDGHTPIDIAFLVVDGVQLGRAIYSGAGITEAAINFGMSAVGVISPVPGVGLALKEVRAVVHAADAIKEASQAGEAVRIVEKTSEVVNEGRTFQTYTKTNTKTGEVYCGRTSGCGTPLENIANRDAGHHMNAKGFGPAQLDKSSNNAAAIRGREQQMIEANGGAKSMGGSSGNSINGISPKNPNKEKYMNQARKEFGG